MKIRPARLALALALFPSLGLACACGCGVFDVGTSSMYANHSGFMAYADYDYVDQSHNWSGTASAPADANADKSVQSHFYTLGGQYFFNRRWGMMAELPYWRRSFVTTDEATGDLVTARHSAMGDIRVRATYTGLSEDMSSGLTVGLKLANGDSAFAGFDADTQIGSGSTDLLLGGYHLGRLSKDNRWTWLVQGQWDQPLAHKANYRPGAEGVLTGGVYYEGWSSAGGLRFSPMAQLRASLRRPDGGADSLPDDTGYARLLFAPGFELRQGSTRLYAEAAVDAWTNARGNQLFARSLWKLNLSHDF